MKVIKDGEIYKLAQITSSDRRNELCGYWVEHKSKENKSMNLRFDSFINLTSIMIVDELGIDHYIGKCPLMKELDELCKKARITY